MITKEALSNKYANEEHELCLYCFVVVIVITLLFCGILFMHKIRWNYVFYIQILLSAIFLYDDKYIYEK